MSHSKISPSMIHRVFACPGSVGLTDRLGIVDRRSSKFAAEGTFLHSIRAHCLDREVDAIAMVGTVETHDGFIFTFTKEMAGWLQPGIDLLRALGGTLYVEKKFDLGEWSPGMRGTADAVVVDGSTLIVDDFKGGAGLVIDAEQNEQLMCYALGALCLAPQADRVEIQIDQPRTGDGLGSSWVTSRSELEAFGERVREITQVAMSPDAPFGPSEDACRWCPCNGQCPAQTEKILALVEFSELEAPFAPPVALTPEQRSAVLTHKKAIEGWLDALHEQALADALAGRPVPGFKAVAGRRGSRTWRDGVERTIVATLGDDAYKSALISPAQADKLMPKEFVAELVEQAEGKPCLVPESDKRQPINLLADILAALPAVSPKDPWE
jgi:hypothetical protein